MKDTDTIKKNIIKWNEIRNKNSGLKLLDSGNVIGLSRFSFEQMQIQESEYIHLYIGAEQDETIYTPIFYMVGDEYDKIELIQLHMDKVSSLHFKSPPYFNTTPNSSSISHENIDVNVATIRSFKWFLYKSDWFTKVKSGENVVRAFKIPLTSITNIFNDESVQNILLFFGITQFESGFNIDIIFCNSTSKSFERPTMYENLTMPCPPYNCEDFALMNI